MDYFFGLEVHPGFHQRMGGGQFDLLQEIVEQEPGFNPQDVEDTRRRVVQEQTVRDGARAFRDALRAAYADICAVIGNTQQGVCLRLKRQHPTNNNISPAKKTYSGGSKGVHKAEARHTAVQN